MRASNARQTQLSRLTQRRHFGRTPLCTGGRFLCGRSRATRLRARRGPLGRRSGNLV